MDLFKIFGKIALDVDSAENQLDKFVKGAETSSGKIGAAFSKIGSAVVKAGTVAITTLATATGAMIKSSTENYAEYEQLVGGSELMFGEAYGYIAEKAASAYKDVQMSQNEYLQQVNGLATGLKTALDGDAQAAAELANRVIKAEADVIAATGNSQEAVQNAFNGIMKSNYTMLDNLQLGITPTKEGFQEVINKVNDWNKANGKATKYQIENLADCQSALVDYIEMQGLADYAANEAAETIQGSLSMVKAAWQNLLSGMADESQDLGKLIDNLVTSAVSVARNMIPKIKTALSRIGEVIKELFPVISEAISVLVSEILPDLVLAGADMLKSLLQGISDNIDTIAKGAVDIISMLTVTIIDMLPLLLEIGLELLIALVQGIADNMELIIDAAVNCVIQLVEMLTDPEMLNKLLAAALDMIMALAFGLIDAVPKLIEKIPVIISNIVVALTDPEMLLRLVGAALELVVALAFGFIKAIPELLLVVPKMYKSLIDEFLGKDWAAVGRDIISKLWEGLKQKWEDLKKWFSDAWESIKGFFGFGKDDIKTQDVTGINGISNAKSSKSKLDGSFATGLDYVPRDGFIAELHKGEKVIPASEAENMRSNTATQNSEIVSMLGQILDAVKAGTTIDINNREFGRLVRGVT